MKSPVESQKMWSEIKKIIRKQISKFEKKKWKKNIKNANEIFVHEIRNIYFVGNIVLF